MNAIMTDFDIKWDSKSLPDKWEGFAEFDRALAEDRLTAYRLKKAWADPINRLVAIGVLILLGCFIAYALVSDLVIGR